MAMPAHVGRTFVRTVNGVVGCNPAVGEDKIRDVVDSIRHILCSRPFLDSTPFHSSRRTKPNSFILPQGTHTQRLAKQRQTNA